MLNGFLNAKRLDIVDNGAVIRFGDVAMTCSRQGSCEGS